jgi:hypothetical protein
MVRLALNWTTVPEQMVCMDGTDSVETLAILSGLSVGRGSNGLAGTQLDHCSRTDGMLGWNIGFD